MILALIESVNGGWNYAPADAPASFLRCLLYDETGFDTIGEAIAAAERDKTIPDEYRPIHYLPRFAPQK